MTRGMKILVMAFVVAGIGATSALAWSHTYVSNATWSASSKANSDFNSNLKGNAISFDNPWGGLPQMGSR